jgi:hypothetical protein
VSTIIIVVANGLAIPFISISNPIYQFPADENIQLKAFFIISIFILFSIFFQYKLIIYKKRKSQKVFEKFLIESMSFRPKYVFYILFLISLFGFVRFTFVSGGINFFGGLFAYSSSYSDYYYQRTRGLSVTIASLPGLGLAQAVSAYINFILLVILVIYNNKIYSKRIFLNKFIDLLLIVYLILSDLTIDMIIGQRAWITISIISIVLLFSIGKIKDEKIIGIQNSIAKFSSFRKIIRLPLNKSFLVSVLVFLFISSAFSLFIYLFSRDIENPILSLVDRAFIVPCGTNNYYYSVFPEKMSFEGFMNSFLPREGLFNDVAFASTNISFGANAFFLAIAYSGSGYLGVIIVSLVFCLVAYFQDCFLIRRSFRFQFFAMFCSSMGFISLTSNSLVGSAIWGGIFTSIFLLSVSLSMVTTGTGGVSSGWRTSVKKKVHGQ